MTPEEKAKELFEEKHIKVKEIVKITKEILS